MMLGIGGGGTGEGVEGAEGGEVRGHGIGYISEVACLGPIAENSRSQTEGHLFGKEGDHAAIGARRVLPGPEDVEIAQAHSVQPHRARVDKDIGFTGELTRSVGAECLRPHVLMLGQFARLSVGAARRGKDESLGTSLPSCLQHIERGCWSAGVR